MNFFEKIISPFIFIIKQTFLLAYDLTGNYGLSIILLSFAVSSLLLPIFIIIERSKKKDDTIKKKMQPLIDEIKRVYKGQERFYYIKTINRQHNYNSFKALIPILSLLIQIPFFIAAYQFLETFEGLKGVNFLFIKDLSIPDGLFGEINILPIIMTLVNLLTAYFYTRNGNTSERKQMLIIAGAFLILLFNLPSGLVLYWTMNNVFSFLRLFVTNIEVFKRDEKSSKYFIETFIEKLAIIKIVFIIIFLMLFSSQIYWALNYNFDDIFLRLSISLIASVIIAIFTGVLLVKYNQYKDELLKVRVKPQIYFSLLFLSIYFLLASQFYYSGENILLLFISILLIIPTQVISFLFFKKYVSKTKKSINKYIIVLLLVLIGYQLMSVILYLTGSNESFTLYGLTVLFKLNSLSNFMIVGILFSLITVPNYIKYNNISIIKITKSHYYIYTLAVFFILGLIFFWKPLIVYASSPDTFEFPAKNIFLYNYKYFLIGLIFAFVSYIITPKRYKSVLLLLALLLVVISFIYSLVIPMNLGSLQVSQFSEQDKLATSIRYFLFEAIFLLGIYFGVKWIIKKSYFKVTIGFLIIINVFVIGQSIISAINTGFFNTTQEEQNRKKSIGIPFSKDKQNILYFFADGFQGWYIKRIMEEEPELKKVFDGFVWYPNTLSACNATHCSMHFMLTGLNDSVAKINDDSRQVKVRLASTLNSFIKKVKEKGYFYSTSAMSYLEIKPDQIDNFIPRWNQSWEKWSEEIPLRDGNDVWKKRLYENALFYSVPLFLKPKIYNKTKWLSSITMKNKKEAKYSLKNYNFLRLLPYTSVVNEGVPNFILIHDMTSHNPYNAVTEQGEMVGDVTPYENHKWIIQQLAQWIKWMKKEGVYDNTKIVLVSDHGVAWEMTGQEPDIKGVVKKDKNDPNKISSKQYWRLNALLMVKDFNSKGSLKEDWRLMSNGDVPAIIFNENDPTKKEITTRTLSAYRYKWKRKLLHCEVTDNIFDLKNWKIISKNNKSKKVWKEDVGRIYMVDLLLDKSYINKERNRAINIIKNNDGWLNSVKKQAVERNISLDSMLVIAANYKIENEKNHITIIRAQIIYKIKHNEDWLNNEIKNAEKLNISLDSMLVRAADYHYNKIKFFN